MGNLLDKCILEGTAVEKNQDKNTRTIVDEAASYRLFETRPTKLQERSL